MSDIKGKVAIVTGASSGIGESTAEVLAAAGATVVLAARRRDRLDELAGKIKKAGGTAHVMPTDIASRAEAEKLVEDTVATCGQLDIFVANAGVMPLSFMKNALVDEWERMVDVNIKGVLFPLGKAIPHMVERNTGHIVVVGSVAGTRVRPSSTVYSATKYAVRALCMGMQQELSANHNIRVTCIEPGAVTTELTRSITDEDVRNMASPMGKIRRMDAVDIANGILYAVTAPAHVNVNELVIRPTEQPI